MIALSLALEYLERLLMAKSLLTCLTKPLGRFRARQLAQRCLLGPEME